MERGRICVLVHERKRIGRMGQVQTSCLSFTLFLFCCFSLPSRLPLCPWGEPYRLAAWIVPPLYMPRPCVVWLNCHCAKHKRERHTRKGYGYIYGGRERNEWPCRLTNDSEIFLFSSFHHASCVCLMGREWHATFPPLHPTSLFSCLTLLLVSPIYSLDILDLWRR